MPIFVYFFSKRTSIKTAMITGAALLPMSLFVLGTVDDIIFKCIAMVVFTLGEMLVFTMMDIRIDELSDCNYKGTYYSLAGLQKSRCSVGTNYRWFMFRPYSTRLVVIWFIIYHNFIQYIIFL